jgi:hypothetical protein
MGAEEASAAGDEDSHTLVLNFKSQISNLKLVGSA